MFQRKPRRFRRRSDGRKNMLHNNPLQRMRTNQFSNGSLRNNFKPSLSAERSLEKYNLLAKEALSSGDKTLSENYLQHADHFARIIEERNKNRNEIKVSNVDKSRDLNTTVSDDKNTVSDDKNTAQSNEIKNKV